MMVQQPANSDLPNINDVDFSPFRELEGQVRDLFQDVVNDVTDPRFRRLLADLAEDSARVASLNLREDVSAEQVSHAKQAIKARAHSLMHVPGLIAASRKNQFWLIFDRVVDVLVQFGSQLLASQIGRIPRIQ